MVRELREVVRVLEENMLSENLKISNLGTIWSILLNVTSNAIAKLDMN